jgi:hypothetical protein
MHRIHQLLRRVTARGVSQIWQSNLNQGAELYRKGMEMAVFNITRRFRFECCA